MPLITEIQPCISQKLLLLKQVLKLSAQLKYTFHLSVATLPCEMLMFKFTFTYLFKVVQNRYMDLPDVKFAFICLQILVYSMHV